MLRYSQNIVSGRNNQGVDGQMQYVRTDGRDDEYGYEDDGQGEYIDLN